MKKLPIVTLVLAMISLSFAMFNAVTIVGMASGIPPMIPNTYVQDHANVLTPEDEATIQNQLTQLKIKHNLEFGVATVTTTEPRHIDDYALEMARTYGIGSKDGEKRGILLLLAIKDRKWRFEISRHMESVLTDGQSGTIGRNILVPRLKVASKSGTSKDWRDAFLVTIADTEQQFLKNIEPEQKDAPYIASTDSGVSGTAILLVMGTIGGLGLLGGGGYGLFAWRRRRREEEEEREEQEQLAEEARQREVARKLREEKERKKREAQLAKEKAEREAHQAWLKTPEGRADTKRREKEAREAKERHRQAILLEQREQAERERKHKAWLLTPAGIADTKAKEIAKKERLAREKREREAERVRQVARNKENEERREREEEERAARRRRDESSYSSSSYSSSSSSSSDWGSSSSSSGGFSGGNDYGGGGSSGDW